jgi:hypothetical protein
VLGEGLDPSVIITWFGDVHAVLPLVLGIAPQEFPGELGRIKVEDVGIVRRRAPIGCWRHLCPPARMENTHGKLHNAAGTVACNYGRMQPRGVALKASPDADSATATFVSQIRQYGFAILLKSGTQCGAPPLSKC